MSTRYFLQNVKILDKLNYQKYALAYIAKKIVKNKTKTKQNISMKENKKY